MNSLCIGPLATLARLVGVGENIGENCDMYGFTTPSVFISIYYILIGTYLLQTQTFTPILRFYFGDVSLRVREVLRVR